MRVRGTAWVVALPLASAGCSLVSNPAHVIGYQVRRAAEDSHERHRDRRLADAAWAEVGRGHGFSRDHADGFKDGFVEHLFRGTCEPPPLAPARYRAVRNQTEAGYRAAEDWLTGFRHGVTEAKARGLRDLVTGPSAFRTAAPPLVQVPPPPPDWGADPVPLPQPTPVPPAPAPAAQPPPQPMAPQPLPPAPPPPTAAAPAAPHEVVPAAAVEPVPAVPRIPFSTLAEARLLAVTPGAGGPTIAPAVRTATAPPPPRPTPRVRAAGPDGWATSPGGTDPSEPVWRPAAN